MKPQKLKLKRPLDPLTLTRLRVRNGEPKLLSAGHAPNMRRLTLSLSKMVTERYRLKQKERSSETLSSAYYDRLWTIETTLERLPEVVLVVLANGFPFRLHGIGQFTLRFHRNRWGGRYAVKFKSLPGFRARLLRMLAGEEEPSITLPTLPGRPRGKEKDERWRQRFLRRLAETIPGSER